MTDQPPDLPGRIARQVSELESFTIYDHPLDAPEWFVVRRWTIRPGAEPVADPSKSLAATVDEARAMVPPGLICFARAPDEDPVIVETWM